MATQPEAKLTKKLIDRLKKDGFARKVHQSRFGSGEPDIDACIGGRSIKVEVKVPGNIPTPLQYASLRRWEAAGALAGWVDSMEGLEALLVHRDDREWSNPQLLLAHDGHAEGV